MSAVKQSLHQREQQIHRRKTELIAFFATTLAVGGQNIVQSGSAQMHLELWQIINLIGAPLLALLFAQPVIDDLTSWIRSIKSTQ